MREPRDLPQLDITYCKHRGPVYIAVHDVCQLSCPSIVLDTARHHNHPLTITVSSTPCQSASFVGITPVQYAPAPVGIPV